VDRGAPRLDGLLDVGQRDAVEQRLEHRVQVAERAERAGHDDQPASWAQDRRERAQDRVRATVGHVDELVGLRGLRAVRHEPGDRVGHHDVHRAEFRGQAGHGGGVGDVQHAALDPAHRVGDTCDGVRDPFGVASGQQYQVVRAHPGGESLDDGEADALVGAGDHGDAGSCHDIDTRNGSAMRPTRVGHS
jgi:hypothetical protein